MQVDMIYTDFATAFDSVTYKVLVAILQSSGFYDPFYYDLNSF